MDDSLARREAGRPSRRVSAAAELGASSSLQDGEVNDAASAREAHPGADRLCPRSAAAAGRMERRNSAPQMVYQRYMPMAPLKLTIPRKTREKRAVFHISTESREYEDMMTILTSSYIDTSSAGWFTYSKPRLVHSEQLEKEFVEKRKEMKADGRTEKELEESYCFLLTDALKSLLLCEKGLFVGQSWITLLGNPTKGVYLSRYSDLLQNNAFTPGATGEIIIFKVMKGKVKSIYENMKNLLDPTPRFDSHISKNASKVTSVTSYRAFELTQQYFYEYSFDELRERPRQVCPYAIVSFQIKGKDSPLPSKPLAPIRLNSQSAEGSKERAQFTVWSGDLMKDDRVLFQISLRSFSPPFLPHRLPEKLEIGYLMRLDQVTKLLPSNLFSYNLYNSSQEVVNNGHCCSLLEVTDRNRFTTSVTRLLQELEIKRVVLVIQLTEKGFLFLLSSVQMATPTERGESWKRCLQALFVFPETRDMAKSTPQCATLPHDASEPSISGATVMPQLTQFIPALHHALVKARANPPAELSAGVERQAREYLVGLNDGTIRQYPMGEFDEQGQVFPPPKHHRVNMDSYLHSYLYSPALYLLSVARAKQMVEMHCGPDQPQEVKPRKNGGGQREATSNTRDGQANSQKMQQLIDLVLTCKSNAENEVKKEVGEGLKVLGKKRKLEQETAERALKFLKASQEPGRHHKNPVEGSQVPSSPVSLTSVIGSVGLKDVDLREDGSELANKLLGLLTGLTQAAGGTTTQSFCETTGEGLRESSPFDRLATKLGLPTNCDIDLRKQEELEEQTAGSVSSLEGFSPSSHSGETNHHGAGRGGGLWRRTGGYEEEEGQGEIPWVLIPITGLCSERYTQRDRNIPQDPRFQHFATATSITTTTKPRRKSPTLSPEPSPSASPFHLPSVEAGPALSPSQCPSPDPSPPISPSQCPSPESSPSPSPSQCPSPAPSLSPSPSQCPSPEPSPPPSPSHCWSPKTRPPLSSSWCQSLEPENVSPLIKKQRGANEERLTLIASREFTGVSNDKGERPQGKEKKTREPLISASIRPCNPPSLEQKTLPPPAMRGKEDTERKTGKVKETQVELSKKEKKARPVERVWKQGEADGVECKPNEEEVVDMMQEASSGKEQKGKSKELAGGSGFPPVSSAAVCPHRGIDSIVEKHVGDFSSEIQLLLQEESIHYSFPQSPHSTSSTEVTTPQHTLPYASISQFSQYVSFFNPCPPVHEYLSSLRDSINSMLTEFDDSWPRHKSDTSQTNSDATLANRVSAFVASVRAANAKTGRDDEVSAPCGELNAADASPSGSQSPALSRGGEVWRPDATNCRNPTTSHVTLSTPTSASAYKPASTTVLCPPNKSQQSQWNPHKSHTLETRTVTQDIQQTQDNSSARTVLCTAGVEGGRTLSSTDCNTTLSGYSSVSVQFAESSEPSEPVSSLSSVSIPGPGVVPTPPAAALSSLIGQLQPEVFSNLVKIIKDVKRNSVQFYLHCTEPGDQVYEDVRELLLKQGNVEQTPVAFLNQESSDDRLLVIIKNKDVAGHIHKIPGLVSLKRHSSVVFLGIDTLDDIRNNSYNELFVSGGCIISDDFVLNPDFITNDQLAALLMFLEKHSSVESVWRWKVHCKTHKRLKEQARFRRDAANLLDMLSAYQKRQIVEFLPYHHCDMMIQQSPNLDCLIELQARYTQYRHTIFLTEHHLEKFFAYSSGGIIVSSIEEILHNFTRMVGCHDIKDKQPFIDDLLAPKGHSRQVSHGDSASGSEHSPSIFPEQIHSLPSGHQPQRVLSQPGASIPSLPHLSDQLVPDSSCRDRVMPPSDKDCEVLRRAISQLRAERQAQLKQLQQQQHLLELQAELSINPIKSCTGTPAGAHSNHTTPPDEGHPDEPVQLTPGRAVAATLDLIHSTLQPELGEERQEAPTQGPQREAGDGDQRGGNHSDGNSDMSTLSSNHKATAVMGASNRTELANNRRDKEADPRGKPAFSKAAQHGASTCSATASSVDGDGSSGTQSGREQPVRADKAPPSSSTAGRTKVTGNITAVTDHDGNPSPALPQLQPIQRHPNKQQLNPSHPPHSQHRGSGLLQSPLLPRLHSQPFSPGPMLGPLTALGGIRSLLGPTPVWSGSLGPTGAAALVWGFQQTGRDFSSPGLLGGYHGPAGQDGRRYRGGQRGGGFNGM